jgi:branched-chain amino acid transport system ATP-binding protein
MVPARPPCSPASPGSTRSTAGRVELLGQDITGMAVHRIARAGMVRTFQITQPFAKLTVHENIAVGAYQKYPDRRQSWEHARSIARQVAWSTCWPSPQRI